MFFELLLQHINTINLKRFISTKLAKPKPSPNGLGFLVWYGYLEGGFEPPKLK